METGELNMREQNKPNGVLDNWPRAYWNSRLWPLDGEGLAEHIKGLNNEEKQIALLFNLNLMTWATFAHTKNS